MNEETQKYKSTLAFLEKFRDLPKDQSLSSLLASLIVSVRNDNKFSNIEVYEIKTKQDLEKVFDLMEKTNLHDLILVLNHAGYMVGLQQLRTKPDYIL